MPSRGMGVTFINCGPYLALLRAYYGNKDILPTISHTTTEAALYWWNKKAKMAQLLVSNNLRVKKTLKSHHIKDLTTTIMWWALDSLPI